MTVQRTHQIVFSLVLAFIFSCSEAPISHHTSDELFSADSASIDDAYEAHFYERANDDHDHFPTLIIPSEEEARRLFDNHERTIDVVQPSPVRRLGFLIGAEEPPVLYARVQDTHEQWSSWKPIEITWFEDQYFVGRIFFDSAGTTVQLRSDSEFQDAIIEFHDTEHPSPERLTRDLPFEKPITFDEREFFTGDFETVRQQLTLPDDTITRVQWRARDPEKVCNSIGSPYRATIHHTGGRAASSGDESARMRSIQAFHIDSRGWCDIGYHFNISLDGDIYQARKDERRPGAHVGGSNAGNVGIGFLANFEHHDVPAQTQFEGGARLLRWLHEKYDIPLDRSSIRGHQEWPDQATACPGKEFFPRLGELVELAKQSTTEPEPKEPDPLPEPGPVEEYMAALSMRLLELEDVYSSGSSHLILDSFPGDEFRAEILFHNQSEIDLEDVELIYEVTLPYIAATEIMVESDAPHFDQMTWRADSGASSSAAFTAPRNTIEFASIKAQETKRIIISLDARQYGFGGSHRPLVRTWIKSIDSVYGPQTSYDATPSNNAFGHILRASNYVDVLSRSEWQFAGQLTGDHEGWSTVPASTTSLQLQPDQGFLSIRGDHDTQLISPIWTRIQADVYDTMVLRVRSTSETTASTAVSWSTTHEEAASNENLVRFVIPNDGEFHTLLIPLHRHGNWRGAIARLDFTPWEALAPGEKAHFDIEKIFFQASATRQTNSAYEDYLDQPPVELIRTSLTPDMIGIANPTIFVKGNCNQTPSHLPTRITFFSGLLLSLFVLWGVTRPQKHANNS